MGDRKSMDTDLALFEESSIGPAGANKAVQTAWNEIMADGTRRAEAAALLGVKSIDLPETCPFGIKAGRAGSNAVEYTLVAHVALIFAQEVVWDLAKDVVKDATKAAFLKVWHKLVRPEAEKKMTHEALGHEKKLEDDVQ